MNLDDFNKKKNLILNFLYQTKKISKEINSIDVENKIDNLINHIESNKFNIVVVGRFSRGKSTFINALLRKKILPSSSKPTTAVISEISYSEEPKFTLISKNGNNKVLDEHEFLSIKAPKTVDENEKDELQKYIEEQRAIEDIDYLSVGYPIDFCKNDVKIVDTPGTDDLDQERVEITYRYLNQADAVIMLLQASQLLSSGEMAFLKERILKENIQDIFYIINKKDSLSTKDEECKVYDYAYNNLIDVIPNGQNLNKKLHLVSSLQALVHYRKNNGETLTSKQEKKLPADINETGFPYFENQLESYLADEKGSARLDLYISKFKLILEDIEKMISLKENLINQQSADAYKEVNAMKDSLKAVKYETEKIIHGFVSTVETNKTTLYQKCDIWSNETLNNLQIAVDNYSGPLKVMQIKRLIETELEYSKKIFAKDVTSFESAVLDNEYKHAQHQIKKIWNDFEFKYANTSLSVTDNSLNKIIISAEEKQPSDNEATLGSMLFGGAVGGLLAGAFFPAVALGTMAAWCLGMFGESNDAIKQKIKSQVIEQFIPMSDKMKHNTVLQYETKANSLKNDLTNIIDSKIKDIIATIEDVENQSNNNEHIKEKELLRFKTIKDKINSYKCQIC